MSGELREVLNYPNWMWIIGVLLLALVLVWVGVWLIRWLRSNRLQEQNQIALIPLDEKRRLRYLGFIDEVEGRLNTGDLDDRGALNVPVVILRLQPCLRFENSFPHGLILRMLFLPARTALKQIPRPMAKKLSSIPHSSWITRGRW